MKLTLVNSFVNFASDHRQKSKKKNPAVFFLLKRVSKELTYHLQMNVDRVGVSTPLKRRACVWV